MRNSYDPSRNLHMAKLSNALTLDGLFIPTKNTRGILNKARAVAAWRQADEQGASTRFDPALIQETQPKTEKRTITIREGIELTIERADERTVFRSFDRMGATEQSMIFALVALANRKDSGRILIDPRSDSGRRQMQLLFDGVDLASRDDRPLMQIPDVHISELAINADIVRGIPSPHEISQRYYDQLLAVLDNCTGLTMKTTQFNKDGSVARTGGFLPCVGYNYMRKPDEQPILQITLNQDLSSRLLPELNAHGFVLSIWERKQLLSDEAKILHAWLCSVMRAGESLGFKGTGANLPTLVPHIFGPEHLWLGKTEAQMDNLTKQEAARLRKYRERYTARTIGAVEEIRDRLGAKTAVDHDDPFAWQISIIAGDGDKASRRISATRPNFYRAIDNYQKTPGEIAANGGFVASDGSFVINDDPHINERP